MSLIIEGFERFALGQAPNGGTYATRESDGLGWQIFSGQDANGSNGTATVVDSGDPGVDRGRGVRLTRSTAASGQYMTVGVKLPDNGWTKRIIGFHFYADPVAPPSSQTGLVQFIHACADALTGIQNNLSLHYRPSINALLISSKSTSSEFILDIGRRVHVELHYDRVGMQFQVYTDGVFRDSAAATLASMTGFTNLIFSWRHGSYLLRDVVIDDFYMLDDVGGDTVESLGPCKVDLAVPTSTSEADFTPNTSVAGNYESVGDIPINQNTYVSSATVGARDVHGFPNPLAGRPADDVIFAVQAQTVATSDDIPAQMTTGVGLNGSFVQGQPTTVTATATTIRTTMRKHPTTGQPLTLNDLNSLQSGYEIGDTFGA